MEDSFQECASGQALLAICYLVLPSPDIRRSSLMLDQFNCLLLLLAVSLYQCPTLKVSCSRFIYCIRF